MIDTDFRLLRDAVARNAPALVLAPAVGAGEARRGRLLTEEGSAGGVWVECPSSRLTLFDLLHDSGKPVAVTFRGGDLSAQFLSTVLETNPSYRLNAQTVVSAALLSWPDAVEVTQRRSGYRARVPIDANLKVRVSPLPSTFGDGLTTQSVVTPAPNATSWPAELRDVSVCGMGLVVRVTAGKDGPQSLAVGDPLRVDAEAAGVTVSLSGRVRQSPRPAADRTVWIGLDFDRSADTLAGRQSLAQVARWVAVFQRKEASRRAAVGE